MIHIILGCLSIRDMTGYEIKKLIGYSAGFFATIGYGSIYPTLRKLEAEGLVVSRQTVKRGRLKKVYHLTDRGRQVFVDWLESPLDPLVFKYEMLLRTFFSRNLPEEKLKALISQHLEQLRETSGELDRVAVGVGKTGDEYQQYTLRFGRDLCDFLLKWWSTLLDELEGGDGQDTKQQSDRELRALPVTESQHHQQHK